MATRARNSTNTNSHDKESAPLMEQYIVAIGASAGGLEAIHSFFDNMPSNPNLSFVIIQHLSPNHKSLLAELVAKHTSMQVYEVKNNMPVDPGCIYIIPPKKLMTIRNGILELSEKSSSDQSPNTAIDIFLQSLASDQKEKSIAIILSGTGTDGSRGVELIKEENGLVLIQDPETAKFDGMPRSAISKGVGDLVLPADKMPEELINYLTVKKGVDNIENIPAETVKHILELITDKTGSDFTNYKLPTIFRRISRRIFITKSNNVDKYVELLKKDDNEVQLLSKEFLIGVTKFFRDKEAFSIIDKEVLPKIVAGKEDGDSVKVWINACSTGEEAYSLAILLHKHIQQSGKDIRVRIFATDIDEIAIATASKGTYPVNIQKDIDEKLFDKYFTISNKHCTIIPELRKLIVFAKHDIRKDPPFIKNDLVSCRNMLIYMDSKLQQKILNTFNFSLNPGGYLFLGPSESIASQSDSMEEINKRWKIFKKIAGTSLNPIKKLAEHTSYAGDYNLYENIKQVEKDQNLEEDFRRALLENHNYAAFYIDKQFDIKEATGDFRSYLSLADNVTNLNVLKMVDPSLSATLNNTIRKSWKSRAKVSVSNIIVTKDGKNNKYTITVKPAHNGLTMIMLGKDNIGHTIIQGEMGGDGAHAELINELENELKEARLQLQTAVEDAETANEELQSSNEELLSANEELQSSNEELQSINEELHTLNAEHQIKIAELIELNDDLNNYFANTDIGQVFLDKHLKIRKYNPAAVKFINLIESDISRPFSHISNNLNINLQEDLNDVLKTGKMVEKEVTVNQDRTTLLRILPYIKQGKLIDGIVISFVDVTQAKELGNIIAAVFNATQDIIFSLKPIRDNQGQTTDFRINAANHAAEKMYGTDIVNRSLKDVVPGIEQNGLLKKYLHTLQSGKALKTTISQPFNGETLWHEVTAAKTANGLAVTYKDITEKKEAEDRIRNSYNELNITKNKLKDLNNELENIIAERTRKLTESDERFRLISMATNDALWDWDMVNNTIWWSDAFYNKFGYPNNKQYNIDFFFDNIHPDEQTKIKKGIYNDINKGKRQWSSEYSFAKADGNYAIVLNRSYILLDDNDIPYRMLGSMMDITSLREAEKEVVKNIEQRQFLAEAIPLIVWTADPSGKINFINKNFENYTGAASGERDLNKYISEEQLLSIDEQWEKAKKDSYDFSIEVKLKRKDGQYRWHLLRANAKKDEQGNVVMWVGTYTDIHEQKTATETMERMVQERTLELQETNKALETSNHDLQQFASVASHDLKEPLRKIHLFSNILKDRYLAEWNGGADYLERIISSSSRMTKLINDLLGFSRLSVSSLFEPVNLNLIIEDILSDLELAINEKEAIINIPEFPRIDAVPGQMRQVFQNIISNALKFTHKDRKPIIDITAERIKEKSFDGQVSDNGKYCRIKIVDNGIGFDEKYLDKIFTIFQRLHSRQDYEGTGIGLAICKKIIDKHNGLLTAKGAENVGATFIIILPVKQESSIDIEGEK